MHGRIQGISRTSLWRAWKSVRKEIRDAAIRDVVDYIEFDVNPDIWINRLLRQVSAGIYEPSPPVRYSLAKSSGFSRTMTYPAIPDLVLYRAIADYISRKARRFQQPHVYFLRDQVHKATAQAHLQAQQVMAHIGRGYGTTSQRSFLNWLRFDQYRKRLILGRVYPFIVLTDISNFFDTVLHSRVESALRSFYVPPRMVGLLFFLLERLAIRSPYSDSPRIGLPVDEFDCSRTLAHVVLFAHDRRIVDCVSADAYVRWMDDQNIGVQSRADGLRLLGLVGQSLSALHLTPNAKKSRVLTLSQARRHFHLDIDRMLDDLESDIEQGKLNRRQVRTRIYQIWLRARRFQEIGEWDKVLKRIYRIAGFCSARFMRRYAMGHVLQMPSLAIRVCDYMRCSGTSTQYLGFFRQLSVHDEQVYQDVNLLLLESLLRVEASRANASKIRALAREILLRRPKPWSSPVFSSPAALLLLRFGDGRSLRTLAKCFERTNKQEFESHSVRAAAIVYASFGLREFRKVRNTAAKLFRNPLPEMVRLVESILGYAEVPNRYKARLEPRFDSVQRLKYLDMRTALAARLLSLNTSKNVHVWLRSWASNVLGLAISNFDKKLVGRLFRW